MTDRRELGGEPESEVPDVFKQLDREAHQSFSFLVQEQGATGPTVEYWRDYFLGYQLAPGLRLRVGMERGTLLPFVFLEYKEVGHVMFELRRVLQTLGLPFDASRFPLCEALADAGLTKMLFLSVFRRTQLHLQWPLYLEECAVRLQASFGEIVAYTRKAGLELANSSVDDSAAAGQVIRRATDTEPPPAMIGAGSLFVTPEFPPINRDDFWRISNKQCRVSYKAIGCPSCQYVGNVGVRGSGLVVGYWCPSCEFSWTELQSDAT